MSDLKLKAVTFPVEDLGSVTISDVDNNLHATFTDRNNVIVATHNLGKYQCESTDKTFSVDKRVVSAHGFGFVKIFFENDSSIKIKAYRENTNSFDELINPCEICEENYSVFGKNHITQAKEIIALYAIDFNLPSNEAFLDYKLFKPVMNTVRRFFSETVLSSKNTLNSLILINNQKSPNIDLIHDFYIRLPKSHNHIYSSDIKHGSGIFKTVGGKLLALSKKHDSYIAFELTEKAQRTIEARRSAVQHIIDNLELAPDFHKSIKDIGFTLTHFSSNELSFVFSTPGESNQKISCKVSAFFKTNKMQAEISIDDVTYISCDITSEANAGNEICRLKDLGECFRKSNKPNLLTDINKVGFNTVIEKINAISNFFLN